VRGIAFRTRRSGCSVPTDSDSGGARSTRDHLLRRAIVATGALGFAVAVDGSVAVDAAPARSQAQDVRILNLVLLVEFLEAAFYDEAVGRGRLHGELLDFAQTVRDHEHAHVDFIRHALGAKARKRPRFDFGTATGDPDEFARTAELLEDTAVRGYNGQATNLSRRALAAAASIVSVEARHAAWIRAIRGKDPAPQPTEAPLTAAQVLDILDRTNFVRP
jgi:hypothetical protein